MRLGLALANGHTNLVAAAATMASRASGADGH